MPLIDLTFFHLKNKIRLRQRFNVTRAICVVSFRMSITLETKVILNSLTTWAGIPEEVA